VASSRRDGISELKPQPDKIPPKIAIRSMRLISVNVGTPNEIGKSRGRPVLSGILKKPLGGSVIVRRLNLEGDRQADLTVHGGEDKAVYAYPSEHYGYWKEGYPEMDLPWGSFGENFTTEGLLEDEVHVGDRFVIGSAEFAATQPRFPCFKLGIKFGTNTMIKSFLDSERSGFYLRVLREGQVEAGDEIKVVKVNSHSETMTSIVRAVKRSG
jgi:MOSC domain-containing protein YiiM